MSIKDFMDNCPKITELANNFTVRWSRPGWGFGELTFTIEDGKLYCDSERMSKEFVKGVLTDLVNNATFKD